MLFRLFTTDKTVVLYLQDIFSFGIFDSFLASQGYVHVALPKLPINYLKPVQLLLTPNV